MENLDKLQEVWQADDKNAEKYYKDNKDDILKKARQKSNDVISKVRRNLIKDYIISFLALAVLILWIKMKEFTSFSAVKQIGIIIFVTLIVVIYVYLRIMVWKKLKKVDVIENLVKATNHRIDILSKFLKTDKIASYTTFFLGIAFGVFINFSAGTENVAEWNEVNYFISALLTIFFVIVLYLAYSGSKSFYKNFYGIHLKSLKSIRDELIKYVDEN